MLKQFTTLIVWVSDMQRSAAFYKDVLGLPVEMESPGWSQFSLGGGASIGLHPGAPAPSQRGWTPGFSVDDVKAAKERLVAAGATIIADFHDVPGGVILEFGDPDGNPIDVAQMGISCADLGVVSR